jgi:hypothetical protein
MARKAPQLAKLTRPRLHEALARERLFVKLNDARVRRSANGGMEWSRALQRANGTPGALCSRCLLAHAVALRQTGFSSKLPCFRKGTTEIFGDPVQTLVARPDSCRTDCGRRQQMNIDVSDAFAVKLVSFDVAKDFVRFGNRRLRQLLEQFQDQRAIGEAATGNLTNNERVHDHIVAFKESCKSRIAAAKMVDPDRRVDQDQDAVLCRRRGATLRPGWLPPSLARRLALSRSMSAFRPSCNNVERSIGPVNLIALAIRSSSSVTVVRISLS